MLPLSKWSSRLSVRRLQIPSKRRRNLTLLLPNIKRKSRTWSFRKPTSWRRRVIWKGRLVSPYKRSRSQNCPSKTWPCLLTTGKPLMRSWLASRANSIDSRLALLFDLPFVILYFEQHFALLISWYFWLMWHHTSFRDIFISLERFLFASPHFNYKIYFWDNFQG